MKTDERIKVLCVTYESDPYGGVAVFLINVFRNIDHEKFQLDFLSQVENSYDPYEREIQQANGKIYALHVDAYPAVGKLKFDRKLSAFLKNHPYDIVYINSSAVSFDCISAIVSKYNGAKVIVHSHNTGGRNLWKAPIAYLMKLLMQKQADVLCACSKDAAATAFTAKMIADGHVTIIKNDIDLQKFQYMLILVYLVQASCNFRTPVPALSGQRFLHYPDRIPVPGRQDGIYWLLVYSGSIGLSSTA